MYFESTFSKHLIYLKMSSLPALLLSFSISGNATTRKRDEKRATKRAHIASAVARSAAATVLEESPLLSPPSRTIAMCATSVLETSRVEPLNPMGELVVTPRDPSSEPASTAVPNMPAAVDNGSCNG